MGGLDKGLQHFHGKPLVTIAHERLLAQSGGAPAQIAINANRNLPDYTALELPVWRDSVPDYAGPLAGFLTALRHCQDRFTYLLTVPCDSPLFPLDLLQRLAANLVLAQADLAMASAPEVQADGSRLLRPQPVFCLMRAGLADSLQRFIDGGGRKIGAWATSQQHAKVAFDATGDDPRAFANANTLEELRALEKP
jgi:molybdopterin-guanine dinucleotide biosynthesis protein A